MEIPAALSKNLQLIPIVLSDARVRELESLPDNLKEFHYKNASRFRSIDLDADIARPNEQPDHLPLLTAAAKFAGNGLKFLGNNCNEARPFVWLARRERAENVTTPLHSLPIWSNITYGIRLVVAFSVHSVVQRITQTGHCYVNTKLGQKNHHYHFAENESSI